MVAKGSKPFGDQELQEKPIPMRSWNIATIETINKLIEICATMIKLHKKQKK